MGNLLSNTSQYLVSHPGQVIAGTVGVGAGIGLEATRRNIERRFNPKQLQEYKVLEYYSYPTNRTVTFMQEQKQDLNPWVSGATTVGLTAAGLYGAKSLLSKNTFNTIRKTATNQVNKIRGGLPNNTPGSVNVRQNRSSTVAPVQNQYPVLPPPPPKPVAPTRPLAADNINSWEGLRAKEQELRMKLKNGQIDPSQFQEEQVALRKLRTQMKTDNQFSSNSNFIVFI